MVLFWGGLPGAELREFTDTNGRKIQAELVEVGDGVVSIRMADGRLFRDIPLSRFSEADRRFVKDWVKEREKRLSMLQPEDDVQIEVKKGRRDELNNYGEIDDREQRFIPSVRLTNKELTKPLSDVRATLVIVAESVTSSNVVKVLSVQDFQFGNLPYREPVEREGRLFQTTYDDQNYAKWGYKYDGYVLVLRNSADEITHVKASKPSWEDNLKNVLSAKAGSLYSDDFEHRASSFD